jgi:hypothetical protein
MSILSFGRYALTNCVAVAILARCNVLRQAPDDAPPISAPGAIRRGSAFATHADRGKRWTLPEAKSQARA